jgi:hypothetical protein
LGQIGSKKLGNLGSASLDRLKGGFNQAANCLGPTRNIRLMSAPIIDGSHQLRRQPHTNRWIDASRWPARPFLFG